MCDSWAHILIQVSTMNRTEKLYHIVSKDLANKSKNTFFEISVIYEIYEIFLILQCLDDFSLFVLFIAVLEF